MPVLRLFFRSFVSLSLSAEQRFFHNKPWIREKSANVCPVICKKWRKFRLLMTDTCRPECLLMVSVRLLIIHESLIFGTTIVTKWFWQVRSRWWQNKRDMLFPDLIWPDPIKFDCTSSSFLFHGPLGHRRLFWRKLLRLQAAEEPFQRSWHLPFLVNVLEPWNLWSPNILLPSILPFIIVIIGYILLNI